MPRTFVLSYLRTSCITGSHEFLLSYYEEEPFIEEQPQEITVNMRKKRYADGICWNYIRIWEIL